MVRSIDAYWLERQYPMLTYEDHSWNNAQGSVNVCGMLVIPEYWLGTILGLVGMFAALGTYGFSKRKKLISP